VKPNSDIKSFYKFFTPQVGHDALAKKMLRWSPPILFRDPVELTHLESLPFTEAELLDEVMRQVSSLILQKEHPRGLPGHSVTQAMHRWRKGDKFSSKEDIESSLRNIFVPILKQYKPKLDSIESDWTKFYKRVRVLNGVSDHANIEAWRNNALFHRGVALQFDCHAEGSNDELFDLCKPVEYTNDRLGITSLQGQVANIIGQADTRAQDQFLELMSRKPERLSHEGELRFFHVLTDGIVAEDSKPDTWMTDLPFATQDLMSVTLGMKAPKKERVAITKIVKENYPHVPIYKAHFADKSYKVEFELLHEGALKEE
jgi:hypothetical protein